VAHIVVFDVNETLLDLRALDPHFERIFGTTAVRRQWFGLVLRNALTLTIIGEYHDFVAVAGASLSMVAEEHGATLTDADRAAISATMTNLPPHGDVAANLERLENAGLRLVALTNSPQDAAETQLTNAGIAPLFSKIMSVAPTGRFKPAAAVYQMAADRLNVSTEDMTMVAAHDWDIAGAMAAGYSGAYVTRPGMVINPLFQPPDVTGPDLEVVTDLILQTAVA
jgi:2-haloacid dehalogenase